MAELGFKPDSLDGRFTQKGKSVTGALCMHVCVCIRVCTEKLTHRRSCVTMCTLSVSRQMCMCVSVCAYSCFCTRGGNWQQWTLQRIRPCFKDLDIYPEGTREPCKNLDKGVDMIRFLFRKITLSGVCVWPGYKWT